MSLSRMSLVSFVSLGLILTSGAASAGGVLPGGSVYYIDVTNLRLGTDQATVETYKSARVESYSSISGSTVTAIMSSPWGNTRYVISKAPEIQSQVFDRLFEAQKIQYIAIICAIRPGWGGMLIANGAPVTEISINILVTSDRDSHVPPAGANCILNGFLKSN